MTARVEALGLAAAAIIAIAATVLGKLFFGPTQVADVVMIYVLAVVIVSLRWGLGESIVAAVLSVGLLDFFFIPPLHTFAVTNIDHIVTFGVMFLVAVVISGLTRRIRDQAVKVEAEQLRSGLLASISHDLRTPLAVITGNATTLLDDKVEAGVRRELTESIVSEAERLNALVRNVLDMTRLESKAAISKEWQSLEESVGAAIARVEHLLGTRTIATKVPADLPLVAYDSILLQQVLVNLLENAVKYTPDGTALRIVVEARANEVEIVVADNGPGIAPKDEPKIFEKFYRGAKERGVGLGLAICKAIVQVHGGRIWYATNGGAEFHFTLPIEGTAPPMVTE